MAGTKKKPQYKPKPGYFFNSPFEERKALGYLLNLINSAFLHYKTKDLFELSIDLLGQRPFIEAMKRVCPDFLEAPEFDTWIKSEYNSVDLPARTMCRLLGRELTDGITDKIKVLSTASESTLERRLKTVKTLFHLNDVETELLLFLFLRGTITYLENALNGERNGIADFSMIPRLRSHGHVLLSVKRATFFKQFSSGNIFKAQVLERCGNSGVNLPAWCVDYLSGLGNDDLALEFFSADNDEALLVDDFGISKDELSVLDTLMKSRESKNILFYGAPGAGKTSFARSLARKYHRELLSVKTPDSGEHKDRLRAVYATANLADKSKAVVLVDEADEILNTSNSFFFRSVTQKSWINTFLDTHGKKIIWIANISDEIDPSTMRRFSFSLEFKKVDQTKRMKVLKYELEKTGIENGYFSEEELKDLCASHSVDAGGIVNAVRTVAINKTTKKESAIRKIKTILKNHEKATGGRNAEKIRERTFDAYSIKGLNTSCDMGGIVSGLKEYADNRSAKSVRAVSLLLYGMPGTGKTEFVYYLGSVLKREVMLKRASEIQSKWVGETEKNIASAFNEAGENGNILFFDEADSFLFPRKDAQRSWEKSHTNEILTQLENFSGIAIFATNDIDGLDHAALRRFRFKVRFDPLTPEGNIQFYESLMLPLVSGGESMSAANELMLRNIRNLTPGDFAVVKDQYLFFEPVAVTHEALITALVNEVRHKKNEQYGIGFGRS